MKNFRRDVDDSLRSEYKRSDFGEMVRGKFAPTQVDFAELVSILLACIAEEEGLKFTHHSVGKYLAEHEHGDWTYEIDNANQITLRYWVSESASLAERVSNPAHVTTLQESSDLQNLLRLHLHALRDRVNALS
jgi:hypothetical protein